MKLFNKLFKFENKKEPLALTQITRTETLEGFTIPGIIWNMQYHFTDLQVYSDGLISCWEMVDLPMFRDKIRKNWVVTSIPDGESISIFSLGMWKIEQGQWNHNKDSLYEYVATLVKRLNPTLQNLHNYNGSNEKQVGKATTSKHLMPNPKPYILESPNDFFPKKINGENFHIFYRAEEVTYLAQLSIYPEGQIEITNLPDKKIFQFDDLQNLIEDKILTTDLQVGERLVILGLGSFTINSGEGVSIENKYHEILDKYNELKGAENSIEKCSRIFEEYKKKPSKQLKEDLKDAYEAVPEHQRMFVGTMDTKDYEVRQLIYGDVAKKEWEEIYGYPYPYEDMPEPDED